MELEFEVQGTPGTSPGAFDDVQVDHGGLMAAAAATLRARRCAPVYLAPLGSTDEWPIRSWTVRISVCPAAQVMVGA